MKGADGVLFERCGRTTSSVHKQSYGASLPALSPPFPACLVPLWFWYGRPFGPLLRRARDSLEFVSTDPKRKTAPRPKPRGRYACGSVQCYEFDNASREYRASCLLQ